MGRGCTGQVKRGMLGHSGESGQLRKPGRQVGHRWAGTVRSMGYVKVTHSMPVCDKRSSSFNTAFSDSRTEEKTKAGLENLC